MADCNIVDLIIKIATPVTTVGGIIVGVWQFNKGQKSLKDKEIEQRKFEAIAKFKEIQLLKYKEATEIVSNVIYTEDYQSVDFKKNLKRFWQLYWVELSSVENIQVEGTMKELGDHIQVLENRNFENITKSERTRLQNLGYHVAQAIKESSQNWELPEPEKK